MKRNFSQRMKAVESDTDFEKSLRYYQVTMQILSGNNVDNGHFRQTEQNESRHGSEIDYEKIRKHQNMQ